MASDLAKTCILSDVVCGVFLRDGSSADIEFNGAFFDKGGLSQISTS
jgi:hypothetical protein